MGKSDKQEVKRAGAIDTKAVWSAARLSAVNRDLFSRHTGRTWGKGEGETRAAWHSSHGHLR